MLILDPKRTQSDPKWCQGGHELAIHPKLCARILFSPKSIAVHPY